MPSYTRKEYEIKDQPIWFVSSENESLELDEIYGMESAGVRNFYRCGEFGPVNYDIKTSILSKALEFCKERAKIHIIYSGHHHQKQRMLEEFDSDFRRLNQADAIDLLDAACQLEIKSLFDLMMNDVVNMITHMTPKQINEIFDVHLNNDADDDRKFGFMKMILDCADWPFK